MLKILSLNLNYYVNKHGEWEDRKKLIIEVLKENSPDVVAFQATCSDPELYGGISQIAQFCDALPQYAYSLFIPVSRQKNGKQEGNGIISKHPIHEVENHLLKLETGTDDPVQRLVVKTKFNFANGPFYLYNAHFSWVGEQTSSNIQETLLLLNKVDKKAILVGDLNSDAKDKTLKPFEEAGWTDVWNYKNPSEEGFTFESNKPFTRIDYGWVNSKLKDGVLDVQVIQKESKNVRMSDHLALLITLAD